MLLDLASVCRAVTQRSGVETVAESLGDGTAVTEMKYLIFKTHVVNKKAGKEEAHDVYSAKV